MELSHHLMTAKRLWTFQRKRNTQVHTLYIYNMVHNLHLHYFASTGRTSPVLIGTSSTRRSATSTCWSVLAMISLTDGKLGLWSMGQTRTAAPQGWSTLPMGSRLSWVTELLWWGCIMIGDAPAPHPTASLSRADGAGGTRPARAGRLPKSKYA